MKLLFQITLSFLGLSTAVSTADAFWRHKSDCRAPEPPAAASCAPAGAGAPSCAPGVSYVPETKDVYTTRYRAEVRYVPETVVTRVTTMVPVAAPMRYSTPSSGCNGAPGGGCTGAPGGGCTGAPGANWQYIGSAGSSAPFRYDQLEQRLGRMEEKLAAATDALRERDHKASDQSPARHPAGATDVQAPSDPLLAAARAFKARQAAVASGEAPADRVSSK